MLTHFVNYLETSVNVICRFIITTPKTSEYNTMSNILCINSQPHGTYIIQFTLFFSNTVSTIILLFVDRLLRRLSTLLCLEFIDY